MKIVARTAPFQSENNQILEQETTPFLPEIIELFRENVRGRTPSLQGYPE